MKPHSDVLELYCKVFLKKPLPFDGSESWRSRHSEQRDFHKFLPSLKHVFFQQYCFDFSHEILIRKQSANGKPFTWNFCELFLCLKMLIVRSFKNMLKTLLDLHTQIHFCCKHRVDFVHQSHNRKRHICWGWFPWIGLRIKILILQYFQDNATFRSDSGQKSNSFFSVTSGLISSSNVSAERFYLVEDDKW